MRGEQEQDCNVRCSMFDVQLTVQCNMLEFEGSFF